MILATRYRIGAVFQNFNLASRNVNRVSVNLDLIPGCSSIYIASALQAERVDE